MLANVSASLGYLFIQRFRDFWKMKGSHDEGSKKMHWMMGMIKMQSHWISSSVAINIPFLYCCCVHVSRSDVRAISLWPLTDQNAYSTQIAAGSRLR
nr:hypothetical protein CFP56_74768 [Quercus suber]